jgi:hypothetical protein
VKRIIDKNGRIFGKISIIDVFVLLIVLALGAALYIKFNVLDFTSKSGGTGTITYNVTIYGVRDYTVDGLKPGDLLYDKNSSSNAIGMITAVNAVDAVKEAELIDGTIVAGNYVGRYDVTLTVTAEGTVSGGRYLVGRTYELNANSERLFQTKYCEFEAVITGLEA